MPGQPGSSYRPGVSYSCYPSPSWSFPPCLREGVAAEIIQGLLCQELRSIALAVEAPAEMDIRPVGLTFVHVIPAALKPTLHVSRIFLSYPRSSRRSKPILTRFEGGASAHQPSRSEIAEQKDRRVAPGWTGTLWSTRTTEQAGLLEAHGNLRLLLAPSCLRLDGLLYGRVVLCD
jgi:hypothetical protein